MVQISHNFGNSNVNGLGNLGKVQQNNGDSPKPETVINELKIFYNGQKVYDDGKIDKKIDILDLNGKNYHYTDVQIFDDNG